MGIAKLMFQLGWRPRGIAAQVPLLQQRPSFVDRKVEPLDQYTGGVKGPIVAALAGNRWGDLGEVGSRAGEAVRLWSNRWNRTGSASCAGSGRVLGSFRGFAANASFMLSTADVEGWLFLAGRLFGQLRWGLEMCCRVRGGRAGVAAAAARELWFSALALAFEPVDQVEGG